MILFALAYLGGVLTIVSPCILPVLPFVFARADRPFLRSGLPMLIGMAATFALSPRWRRSAAAGRRRPTSIGRGSRSGAAGLVRPDAAVSRASPTALMRPAGRARRAAVAIAPIPEAKTVELGSSLLLGVATGLLWAPCAGPILGLILTGAALQGASVQHHAAAARLCRGRRDVAGAGAARRRPGVRRHEALAGRRRMGPARSWRRRAAPASPRSRSGLDTGFLARVSLANTASVEQKLLEKFHAAAEDGATRLVECHVGRSDDGRQSGHDDEGHADRPPALRCRSRRGCRTCPARWNGSIRRR